MPSVKLLHILRKNKSKKTEFEFHIVTGTVLILLGIRLMRQFYDLINLLQSFLNCRISPAVSGRRLILRGEKSR